MWHSFGRSGAGIGARRCGSSAISSSKFTTKTEPLTRYGYALAALSESMDLVFRVRDDLRDGAVVIQSGKHVGAA